MRLTWITASIASAGLVSSEASASFVRFADCVQECEGSYWRRVAWTLDCELELAACIATLGGNVAYAPTVDPECLLRPPGTLAAQEDDSFPFSDMAYRPGDLIDINLAVLNIDPNYEPGTDPQNDFGTMNDYTDLINGNTFPGQTDIVDIEIVALSAADFAPVAAAGDAGDPLADGLNNPLWGSGTTLYSGTPGGAVLDTSGLDAGGYILRVGVVDLINGSQFGLSSLTLVPAPGTIVLLGTGGLLAAKRRR